jgi:hypothetical protein
MLPERERKEAERGEATLKSDRGEKERKWEK